ncbi:MAG TPA: hypothetical protein VF669_06295 [Tepidisphaeraceae bacterium]|jgi:hypothetical protein
MDWRYPSLLHSVQHGMMIIASDYSGQHQHASHEAHSFVVTTADAVHDWQPIRTAFRKRWLPDGRRISFKKLSKPRLRRALAPFLVSAAALRGNAITFLIDHRIESMMEGGADALMEAFPDCFPPGTPKGTVEKMFRLASLLALLITGLRREDQISRWISDHDETLETFDRRERFARLCAYVSFLMSGWAHPADNEFCTTEHPATPEWAEDLLSICDVLAGSYCQLSSSIPASCGSELWTRIVPSVNVESRAREVGTWLCSARGNLRHILLRLELDHSGLPRASAQFFAGAFNAQPQVVWHP